MKKKTSAAIERSRGEKIFEVFNILFMCLMWFVMIYPLYYVLVASFSNPVKLVGHTGMVWAPIEPTLAAYRLMAKNPMILRGFLNTFLILAGGLTVNMVLTSIGAFFFSRRNVKLKSFLMKMVVFTMFFSGGLIPFYFTVHSLGLLNTYWSLILPGSISTFNMIILRTSFEAVPYSLEESARLDGANHIQILLKIILPLSKATLAVIALYYTVSHWNSWFNAMLFIDDRDRFPLQLVLREILIQNETSSMMQMVGTGEVSLIGESIKYAVIVVATLPILCVYPFVQKHFVKGVMIGAVKG